MGAGPLSACVAAVCDEGDAAPADPARDHVRRVRRRLDEPLRLAIAGRLTPGMQQLDAYLAEFVRALADYESEGDALRARQAGRRGAAAPAP